MTCLQWPSSKSHFLLQLFQDCEWQYTRPLQMLFWMFQLSKDHVSSEPCKEIPWGEYSFHKYLFIRFLTRSLYTGYVSLPSHTRPSGSFDSRPSCWYEKSLLSFTRQRDIAHSFWTPEIRTIPNLKHQHHPVFLSECTRALELCYNLQSFRCTVHALPPLLVPLQGKRRLQELRVHANITTAQAEKLAEIHNLTSLCLDFGSWNIIDVLPRWTPKFSSTLTSLCLYVSHLWRLAFSSFWWGKQNASELNENVLDQVLQQLPGLLGLHVIGCGQIDHVAVLRLVSHTPLLESLSLSTTVRRIALGALTSLTRVLYRNLLVPWPSPLLHLPI